MTTRLEHIAPLVARIRALGHGCCVVGGVAVSLHVRDRFTKDIDLAVAVASDAEAEHVAGSLLRAGYPVRHLLEQTERNLIATIRFALPGGAEPELDLLFHSCGIEGEIVAAAEPVSLPDGHVVPVARLGHLIAMKLLSESDVRATDRSDLMWMVAAASALELKRAKTAAARIEKAGFARGKDLQAVLQTFLARRRKRVR